MYFIVLWISYVFYCFLICLYFIVLWFLLFEIFIWINIKLNSWYTKQKEDKISDLQAKIRNSHCHLFCTQNEKKSHFSGWSLVTKGHVTPQREVRFSQTWCQNMRKTSKKKVMKRRGWKRGGFPCAAKFVWGGLWGPPPPPVQLGLMLFIVRSNMNQIIDSHCLTIHLYKELRLDSSASLVFRPCPAFAADGVYLINEDGAWCVETSLKQRTFDVIFHPFTIFPLWAIASCLLPVPIYGGVNVSLKKPAANSRQKLTR